MQSPFGLQLLKDLFFLSLSELPLLLIVPDDLQPGGNLIPPVLAILKPLALFEFLFLLPKLFLFFLILFGFTLQFSLKLPIAGVKRLQSLEVFRGDLGFGFGCGLG